MVSDCATLPRSIRAAGRDSVRTGPALVEAIDAESKAQLEFEVSMTPGLDAEQILQQRNLARATKAQLDEIGPAATERAESADSTRWLGECSNLGRSGQAVPGPSRRSASFSGLGS